MYRILLFFLLLIPKIVFSQATFKNISGKVLNTRFEPLPYATVKIFESDITGIIKKFGFSNAEGKFLIHLPITDSILYIQISCLGYETKNLKVTDSIFNTTTLFLLEPLIKELPGVHVKTDRGITKRGDTTSFRVSAFAKGNEENVADLIKKLPGFRIDESGSLSFNGKSISAVLVEDDDLFGRGYSKLINNASVNGIEKIEVIENFKDNSKLENSLNTGKQTVVNLKYKKIGIRNFGQSQIGYAPNQNLLDAKISSTTLAKKIKGVSLFNKNQIGFLAQKLYGLSNENSLPYNNNIQHPTYIDNITSPIGLSNIQPLNINTNRIFDNNSTLISTNLLIKPLKKILFKNNYSIIYDNFFQDFTNTTNYLNTVIPNTIIQKNRINKNNKYFFSEGELTLNWNQNQQTRVYYTFANGNIDHSGDGFFQLNAQKQNVKNLNNLVSSALTHIIILNEKSYFNFKYSIQSSVTSSNYLFDNPLADTGLRINNNSKWLQQNLSYQQNTNFVEAIWFRKMNIAELNISYSSNFKQVIPYNSAFYLDVNNILNQLPNQFFINQKIYFNNNELSIQIDKEIKKILKINLSSGLRQLNYRYGELSSNKKNSSFLLLPKLSVGWNVAKNQMLSFNSGVTAELPLLEQLNAAPFFTNINSISKGVDTINIQKGYFIDLNYSYYDPTGKKIILNVNTTYSKTPTIYNYNFTGRGLYAFYSLLPFYNNNTDNITIYSSIDKNLVDMKSWLKVKLLGTFNNSFTNTNNELTINKNFYFQSEMRFSTNWDKCFNLNTAFVFTVNKQKSVFSNLVESSFLSKDWLLNTTLEFKLHSKFFIDVQYDYLINRSFNQAIQHINFLDAKCKYVISSKWHTSLLLRNIFNTNAFVTNNSSVTRNIFQNFTLTPFIGLFSLGYKF